MPRPKRCRQIGGYPEYWKFFADNEEEPITITLSLEEYETIRLIDLLHKTQEECALEMDISRTTVTAIYNSARQKLADALVNGKNLLISGGEYRLSPNISTNIKKKGNDNMRIAVTYDNGEIFQHFGKTEEFKFYDTENDKIVNEQVVNTNGQGHGALAGFLKNAEVDVLICGGIGGGAQMAMHEAGIRLYGGNSGNADDAVKAFLSNTLVQNDNPTCDHHHEHGEEHSCGSHGCKH